MNPEIVIIASMAILALLSIVLGIINWILLSTTSNKILVLEEAIEKKGREFDLLKKERAYPLQEHPSFAEESLSAPQSEKLVSQENPGIEVVRNVRANFQQPENENFENVVLDKPQPPPSSGDILDILDDGARSGDDQNLNANELEIILFSQSKKDTDFALAWKNLKDFLPKTGSPHIWINFKNVMFLYEKELQYLEKIQDIVSKQHGRISYINCHGELAQTIALRPQLAHHVNNVSIDNL